MSRSAVHCPRLLWLATLLFTLAGITLLTGVQGYLGEVTAIALFLTSLCLGIRAVTTSFECGRLRWNAGRVKQIFLSEMVPPVLVVLVTCILLWACVLGHMPQSQDHPIHLTRAWHFVTKMLANGQLSGWSDYWFAGWPAGEDYPPGADWLVASFYLVSFGLFGWETSYAYAFLFMYIVVALSFYGFGRVYFGKVAGLLAALLFLFDRGIYREGGWSYTVWWGVWPQMLSTGLTLLTFSVLDRVVRKGDTLATIAASSLAGLALLSHPMSLIYFAVGLPLYVLSKSFRGRQTIGLVFVRSVGVVMLGTMLASFWLIPFIAKGSWMAKYGELWKSLPQMGSGIIHGNLFANMAPPILWVSLGGSALAIWRRNRTAIFLTLFVSALLLFASSTIYQALDLPRLSSSFSNIQYQRLSIPAKAGCFLLAGYMLSICIRTVASFHWGSRNVAIAAILIIASAPIFQPIIPAWPTSFGKEIGRPLTKNKLEDWSDYQAFLSWAKEQRALDSQFYRIAYVAPYNDHFFGAAPVYTNTPAYKIGYTPAANFIHKPDKGAPELYKVLSVRFIVTRTNLSSTDRLELIRRFGRIRVYRFLDYSPQRFTIKGVASVDLVEHQSERFVATVSGAAPSSRLILHTANYPNWTASLNRGTVPIATASVAGFDHFISVPLHDGNLVIEYGWPLANRLGASCSCLSLMFLVLLGISRSPRSRFHHTFDRLSIIAQRFESQGGKIAVILLLTLVSIAVLRWTLNRRNQNELSEHLSSAHVSLASDTSETACQWQSSDRWQCSHHSWNYVGIAHYRIDNQLRRCIWAHPVRDQKLIIRFPAQRIGRSLRGHHGLLDDAVLRFGNGSTVMLGVQIDDQLVATIERPNEKGWVAWSIDTSLWANQKADIILTVTAKNSAGRHYCFTAQID